MKRSTRRNKASEGIFLKLSSLRKNLFCDYQMKPTSVIRRSIDHRLNDKIRIHIGDRSVNLRIRETNVDHSSKHFPESRWEENWETVVRVRRIIAFRIRNHGEFPRWKIWKKDGGNVHMMLMAEMTVVSVNKASHIHQISACRQATAVSGILWASPWWAISIENTTQSVSVTVSWPVWTVIQNAILPCLCWGYHT